MSKRDCAPEDYQDEAYDTRKRQRSATLQPQASEADAAQQRANDSYTVGWICAISTEYVAAQAFLDEMHDRPEHVSPHDNNDYTLGRIGKHDIVIAVLPDGEYGTSSAATVARDMLNSFPNIKIGLMVGIGGGSPSAKNDIRLGDIVVSTPRDGKGGVFQYDFGKTIQGRSFRTTGHLNQAPSVLRAAVNGLKAHYESEGHQLGVAINRVLEKKVRLRKKYSRPDRGSDRLFRPDVIHPSNDEASCETVCSSNPENLIPRLERAEEEDDPAIYYGLIASANQLMKDASVRDALSAEMDVLCFEMEAAGLMNHFPCLVIRGICDYSDSHKNKQWQGYAAMTAAAYTKDLLNRISPSRIETEKRICDVISDVQERVLEVSRNVNALLHDKQAQERDGILNWLTNIDYTSQQSDYISRRQEGTGQWLFNSEQFLTWLKTEKQTLYCPGIPGAGKTIIASSVIDDLHTRYQKDANIGLAYLYCDFRRQHEQRISDLLMSLLKQLAQQQSSMPEAVLDLYNKYRHLAKRPVVQEISETLQSVSALYSKTFIVVDALDECQITDGCRTRLLTEMFSLQKEKAVNIFTTSRPLPEIVDWFKESTSLEIYARDEDVQKYLDGNMARLPSFVLKSPELQKEVKTTIAKAINGMFLLAPLHIDSLTEQPTVGHIKAALRNLPTELDQTYEQAMSRIESQGKNIRELAKKVLTWVVHARRQLSTTELLQAVAVEAGNKDLDPEFIPSTEMAGSVCAGLVIIDTKSNVVRLVHYTTQDYFDRTRSRWFQSAQSDMTIACVTYLSFNVFASGFCNNDQELQERLLSNPLYDYASNQWGNHARQALPLPMEVLEFLRHAKNVEASSQVLMTNRESMTSGTNSQDAPRNMSGLHLAAHFGVVEAVKALFGEQAPDLEDSNTLTPLYYAANGGHQEVVKLMLEKGADLEFTNKGYDDLQLQVAAEFGYEEAVKLFLDKGINVNCTGNYGHTPLSLAARKDHAGVVKLLLERGADQELKDEYGRTPLLWAAQRGNNAILRLLIEKGANIEFKGTEYGASTLSWAAMHRQKGVVKVLIENGADPESKDNFGRTALWWEGIMGHEDIVDMLLEKGADPGAEDNDGRPPLPWAVEKGYDGIVRKLLQHGADPEPIEIHNRTTLSWAAEKGFTEMVEALVDHGANLESKDFKFGRTPLIWAVRKSHEETAKVLLNKGADAGAQDKQGRTPLSWATENGLEALVELLTNKTDDSTPNDAII